MRSAASLAPIGSNRGKREFPSVNGSSGGRALNRPKGAGEWLKSAELRQPRPSMSSAASALPTQTEPSFQLGDLARVVRERRALVRNVALVVIAATVVVLLLLPTLYAASASAM